MEPDQLPDDVQPEGQGESGAGSPYQSYLERIPEQVRGEVEPVFKEWDGQVTQRFQEAAEYRRQWEPYEQAGIRDASPEDVQQLLQFGQLLQNDPQAIAQWYQQYAAQNGLAEQQQQQFDQYGQYGQEEPDLNQLLAQQLTPLQQQLEEINSWRQEQDTQARMHAATEYIEQQIHQLQEKHGDQFNRDWVEKFIPNHIDTDPQNAVSRAFEDYQKLVSSVEKQLVESKARQPQPAEAGGMASTQAEGPRNIKDANAQALAQLRGLNST